MTLGQMTASKRWRTAGDDRTSPAKPPAPHRPHGPLPCEIALEPPSSFAASTLQATHPYWLRLFGLDFAASPFWLGTYFMLEHTSATTIGGFRSQPERCNNAGRSCGASGPAQDMGMPPTSLGGKTFGRGEGGTPCGVIDSDGGASRGAIAPGQPKGVFAADPS